MPEFTIITIGRFTMMTSYTDTEEFVPTVEEEPKKRVAGYRVLSVLVFLIAAGGLFLGAIPSLPYMLGGTSFLTGSLVAGGYELFKDVFSNLSVYFSGGAVAISLNVVQLAVYGFIAVATLISLVCMVVGLCSRKAAEKCAMVSAVLAYLAYFGAFAWALLVTDAAGSVMGYPLTAQLLDAATGITAGALFLVLAVTAIVRRKEAGVAHVCLHLFVVATVLAIVYPATFAADAPYALNLTNAFNAVALLTEGVTLLGTATVWLLAAIAFCLIASAVRMGGKKAWAFDVIMYIFLLAFVAFYAISAIFANTDRLAFFSKQLMPAILLIAAPVAALLGAIVAAIVAHKSAVKAAESVEEEEEEPVYEEPVEEAEAEPVVEEEPVEEAEPEPVAEEEPVFEPVLEEEPVAEPEPEVKPEPVPTPVPEAPMTEFERRMAELARGAQPEAPASAPEPQVQQPYFYPPRPSQPVRHQQLGYFEINTQYTYDPFINTLTPQEKNEFGDIFIACKHGDMRSYLPPYVIGGNNDEFFHRVFIYLGKFRKNISSELLEKLYSYIATIE